MLEDGILKIFHSDTDLIEAEEEFQKEFANILPFEQFQDILKTDSYIPDAEDYESLIRFAIKEKPDISLPEFGFEEFRNALGKHISNDAILIAMKSGCFNMDSFNRFCEWGIFNHNGSFCYDPVRKKKNCTIPVRLKSEKDDPVLIAVQQNTFGMKDRLKSSLVKMNLRADDDAISAMTADEIMNLLSHPDSESGTDH